MRIAYGSTSANCPIIADTWESLRQKYTSMVTPTHHYLQPETQVKRRKVQRSFVLIFSEVAVCLLATYSRLEVLNIDLRNLIINLFLTKRGKDKMTKS